MAMTTASPSIVSPSTTTPVTLAASPRHATPVTWPSRSSAPRACAAHIIAAVKAAGWICAVLSVEPRRCPTLTLGDSHSMS